MKCPRKLKETIERYQRGGCSADEILSAILEVVILMASKQDLTDAVNSLVAADAVNKQNLAAKDATIADLTAKLAAATDATDTVDDATVASIKQVATDLNPPAPPAPPATDPNAPAQTTSAAS